MDQQELGGHQELLVSTMTLYSYTITRDYGFAPNPFGGICSLATCKPQIREHAQKDDWVAGFGGINTTVPNKMVFLMKVDLTCTFDEYWNDPRYLKKKPVFNSNYQRCYGDNIYHHNDKGEWIQENSHHSLEDGINIINLEHDTRINRVLISRKYWYFGDGAIELPNEFSHFVSKCRGYRNRFEEKEIVALVEWIESNYHVGQHGFPSSWKKTKGFIRYKGEK